MRNVFSLIFGMDRIDKIFGRDKIDKIFGRGNVQVLLYCLIQAFLSFFQEN